MPIGSRRCRPRRWPQRPGWPAWISLDLAFDGDQPSRVRLANGPHGRAGGGDSPLACGGWDGRRDTKSLAIGLAMAALGLGGLLLSTPGWALLRPEWGDLGMHRSVVLDGCRRGRGARQRLRIGASRFPRQAIGSPRAEGLFRCSAALALVMLAGVLGQEFYHYVPYKGAPMALPAVASWRWPWPDLSSAALPAPCRRGWIPSA